MKYYNIYNQLMTRAKTRQLSTHSEKHHIIPRCMGGNNDASNLVDLTPEEHFLAHLLLMKIHPTNHSLAFAAHMMGATRQSNKVYGWLKRRYIESCTGIPKSEEAKKNMSLAKQDYIPWNAGIKTGIVTNGCFEKGNIPWNKGKEHMAGEDNPAFGKTWSNEKKNKMSRTNKGRKRMYREDGTCYYDYSHLNIEVNV